MKTKRMKTKCDPQCTPQLVRQLRMAMGLNQRQLAEMLKLTNQTISNVERGLTRSLSPGNWARLLELYGQFKCQETTGIREEDVPF